MDPRQALFGSSTDFLAHTLASESDTETLNSPRAVQLETGTLTLHQQGILSFHPDEESLNVKGLLLSAGIHGNETAPIELLNLLVTDIITGMVRPNRPVLLIMGHPEAMRNASRFLQANMNRLFCGKHALPEFEQSADAKRAADLEKHVSQFAEHNGLSQHFDLHTAIKPSARERFALYPFREHQTPKQHERNILRYCGIDTLLRQAQAASTFSAYTAGSFMAESYTLELGKVKPFGENDLESYQDVTICLKALCTQQTFPDIDTTLEEFEVCHEIIHGGEDFVLHIPDDAWNFTSYPYGFKVWEQGEKSYSVQHDEEFIVFPNAQVPPGQRAGLMLRKL